MWFYSASALGRKHSLMRNISKEEKRDSSRLGRDEVGLVLKCTKGRVVFRISLAIFQNRVRSGMVLFTNYPCFTTAQDSNKMQYCHKYTYMKLDFQQWLWLKKISVSEKAEHLILLLFLLSFLSLYLLWNCVHLKYS